MIKGILFDKDGTLIDFFSIWPEIGKRVIPAFLTLNGIEDKKIELNLINIRDFSKDKHKKVDDTPYGGGAGMAFMGMGMNAAGNVMGGFQQPVNQQPQQPQQQTQQQKQQKQTKK